MLTGLEFNIILGQVIVNLLSISQLPWPNEKKQFLPLPSVIMILRLLMFAFLALDVGRGLRISLTMDLSRVRSRPA